MNTLIVACRTIEDELKSVINSVKCDYPVLWIDSGLHLQPDSLKKRLQSELDHIYNVDRVILAFGYCGNSVIGLTPPTYHMIFPRVDDCITLLLGSGERRNKLAGESGTYFLTKGWLESERNIWVEYQDAVKRYGKKDAEMIYQIMFQNYKRLGVIKTGAYDLESYLKKTKKIAEELKLKYEVFPGTLEYVKKLLTGPWNDREFITINPGETVTMEHIYAKK
ncbi:DUF1638 domain-containing protein [Clostridium luticellarii]|uniref:DUF1638 domain-containing protein n=1 Tax=Clostridium luticellarii TaxID=1691940 RepID=A0A2T0BKN0_9CLOT|nr:DUF1638 domain-containing protein [Clostridium luticellarii]MCI1945063.1 DUF1638 domain-containing protein [Clostridium luticellarii]MCI1967539.1 DUF1638 domain-containing protein [Clostridium luticellarii]MCI1996573.1 DUF1638 domain-containing protein [Clostridium luticellarii]MCI2040888.1 DUF1638 domain-containing protein [Clostridium luticellarii]PRR84417.1 hypothetical protein CLLU_24080 [Clostridium luticellarii]